MSEHGNGTFVPGCICRDCDTERTRRDMKIVAGPRPVSAWQQIHDVLAAHRSELERIETDLRVALAAVDQSTEHGRIVAHHLSAVLGDHLALSILGVGAARRVAARLANNDTNNPTEAA